MADVEIEIDDAEVMALLEAMPQQLNRALRAALTDASSLLLRRLKQYPPPPNAIQGTAYAPVRFNTRAGRSVDFMAARRKPYVRTGTLGKSWAKDGPKQSGDELLLVVGNRTPYARWVQDSERQARVHQGRWQTIQSVAADSEQEIRAMARRRLIEALG